LHLVSPPIYPLSKRIGGIYNEYAYKAFSIRQSNQGGGCRAN